MTPAHQGVKYIIPQLSPYGYTFIQEQEGFTPTVKGDTGGKQEIGYGHDLTQDDLSYPDGITQPQAAALLREDVAKIEPSLSVSVPADCTQNQFDALADFTYECGLGALHQLLAHGWSQVTVQLPRWVHANVGGVETVLEGMVARRAAEIQLFNSP
jgi:lysozyme